MIVALSLLGCIRDTWEEPAPPPAIESGAPMIGAAEGYLRLPVGTPLGGFTARCTCLGGSLFDTDDRDSVYTTSFIESSGVQSYPTIKVIWLEVGGEPLVITKTDTIYSFDGLVDEITLRLEAQTGLDLKGKVIHTTNHSHSSYGDFSHGVEWYLGTDRFDREIFDRFAEQVAAVAVEARGTLQPGKIGVGWARDWDPDDRVYRDRRGSNDDLTIWPDQERPLGKDPHLGIVRFDDLQDQPIALMMNFGMHGIIGDVDNPFVSKDSGGHLETRVEEAFGDRKVVAMFAQGSAGDASPGGQQDGFARMESIGELAIDPILAAWEATPTSADPMSLETASRHVYKHPSMIRVTRDGAVDWSYAPFDDDPSFLPDDQIYASDGSILSPIDEFNTESGAVFCGSGDLDFPVGGLSSNVFPYDQCMQVELLSALIEVFFQLEDGELQLPLPETLSAGTAVTRLGPIPVRLPDGTEVVQEQLFGFFPGEPVYSYGEQWRRRAKAELGYEQAMIIGYSQDHEGYLLPPEDWLTGGYEPDIGVYGPLEAEHVMEGVLDYADELLGTTDVREDPDPLGLYVSPEYPDTPMPVRRPDLTPDAGTRITTDQPYLWTPWIPPYDPEDPEAWRSPTAAELVIPAQVPRVQGIVQLAWEGGDPTVDSPKVVLERLEGSTWEPVRSGSGRVIDEGQHDILMTETPTPLYPAEAEQTHAWWATWQAVGHVHDRAGLPLGTYRLHVTGERYTGSADQWPYDTEPYELFGDEFEVVPATIDVVDEGSSLSISLVAPETGFRLVAMGGDENGDNPVPGPVTVEIDADSGATTDTVDPQDALPRSRLPVALPADWRSVTVTDAYGNVGVLIRP